MQFNAKHGCAISQCREDSGSAPGLKVNGLPDEELVGRFARDRDEDAFCEIVNRYADRVFRIAMKITRDPSDAEEVLQEVFVILTAKAGTFRRESKFSTWLYRVAMNAGYMRVRANKKLHAREASLDDYTPYDESGALSGIASRDFSRRPDRELLSREGMEIIQKSVNELPAQYRVVFHLRHEEGLSDSETAEALGISLSAAKSRIHRARLFLRDKLSDYYYEMEG